MTAFSNVTSLIFSAALMQIAGGLLGVIVPLALGAEGYSDAVIGLIAAVYSAGFMVGAAIAPRAIRQVANIRTFAFSAALCAAAALFMAMFRDPYSWSLARFAQGIGIALMFASVESWMTEATPVQQRGSVLGIYHVVAKLALITGPFFAIGTTADDLEPYIWCGIFLSLALMPVSATRSLQPAPPDPDPYPIRRMFSVAPSGVIGVFIAGFSNTGFLSLLPVYAQRVEGMTAASAAAILMAAAYFGGTLSQWPVGYISDRIDRRIVIGAMGLLSGIVALVLAVLNGEPGSLTVQILIGLWGTGALSFYGLCIAHAADRCEPEKIARMLSGLLFVWASGSVLGPLFFGVVMSSPLGSRGLFIFEAVIGFVLFAVMIWRRQAKAGVKDAQRESYEYVLPTSVVGAEIDPRTDYETDDETLSAVEPETDPNVAN
ncbi:MAG: ABC transporter ATP-binding protein [Ponticaulis sp.]|nr:ABC transporter ATP-binding protein [Ponticaulis sp.]|tara:strand:- start:1086 stop:2381 length:1296 start_codon:yes stop_codon:yes gene_type:complete